MTAARSQLVDPTASGFYHCISRCVRRAFLCGEDALTGRSYEHRKQWVEDRLLALAEIFAVGVYAYAVMGNHAHLVLYVDPGATLAWSADEIAERWVQLTPGGKEDRQRAERGEPGRTRGRTRTGNDRDEREGERANEDRQRLAVFLHSIAPISDCGVPRPRSRCTHDRSPQPTR